MLTQKLRGGYNFQLIGTNNKAKEDLRKHMSLGEGVELEGGKRPQTGLVGSRKGVV